LNNGIEQLKSTYCYWIIAIIGGEQFQLLGVTYQFWYSPGPAESGCLFLAQALPFFNGACQGLHGLGGESWFSAASQNKCAIKPMYV